MLSLDNTYDQKEFFDFDQRLRKLFDQSELPYAVELKIDGVAVSITYEGGILKTAVTREMAWKATLSPRTSCTPIPSPTT